MADPATVGAGFMGMYAVIEITKFLVNKFTARESALSSVERMQLAAVTDIQKSVLSADESSWLKTLYVQHQVKDEDGRPIWYMPKTVTEQQIKIIELLGFMSTSQRDTAHVLERIVDKLDQIDYHQRQQTKQ